jgi:hypothetical protein
MWGSGIPEACARLLPKSGAPLLTHERYAMVCMMRAAIDASREDAPGQEILRRESACMMRFCLYYPLNVGSLLTRSV